MLGGFVVAKVMAQPGVRRATALVISRRPTAFIRCHRAPIMPARMPFVTVSVATRSVMFQVGFS